MSNFTSEQNCRLSALFQSGQVHTLSSSCLRQMSEEQMELFLQEAAAVEPGRYSPAPETMLQQLREFIAIGALPLTEDDLVFMTSDSAEGFLWLARVGKRDWPDVVTEAQYRRIEEFIFQGLLRLPAGCNLKTIDAVEAKILIAEGEAAYLRRKGE